MPRSSKSAKSVQLKSRRRRSLKLSEMVSIQLSLQLLRALLIERLGCSVNSVNHYFTALRKGGAEAASPKNENTKGGKKDAEDGPSSKKSNIEAVKEDEDDDEV